MTISNSIPAVTAHSESADGAKTRIDLTFNTAMAAGRGKIYVTDGALQTVIDPVTGILSTRIAGASHTVEINVADLHFSGSHVYTDALDLQPGHQYSVLIDPGALATSSGRSFAGLDRPGQVAFTTANTQPPSGAPTLGDIVLVSDLGQHNNDLLTSGAFQELHGTINGTLAPGQGFELLIGGSPIDSQYLLVKSVDGGYAWTYNGPVPDGAVTVTARITGGGSVLQETHVNITVDGTSPAVATSPDGATAFESGSPIVITFNEAVYWDESAGMGGQLGIKDANNNVTYIPITSANLTDGGTKLTIPATDFHLDAGAAYQIYLPGTMSDLAGNPVGEYSITFHTAAAAPAGDTTAPHALSAQVINTAGSYNAGKPIEIHVAFDEAISFIEGSSPKLLLNNGASADFVEVNGASEAVFRYTVGTGEDVATLAIADASSLAGSFKDLAGNQLGAGGLNFGVLANAAGLPDSGVRIDTIAPAALTAPVLDAASDSGTSNSDGITNDKTPTLKGSGAEAFAKIELYDGDTVVGETTSLADGSWSFTLPEAQALLDGAHAFSARQTDAAGNAGARSGVVNVTIDTVAPTVTGYTATVELGKKFEIRFSEPVKYGAVDGTISVFDNITAALFSPLANSSSNWEDDMHNGQASKWEFTPTNSGWVGATLTGVQDLAGNSTTIGPFHYEFIVTILSAGNPLLPVV